MKRFTVLIAMFFVCVLFFSSTAIAQTRTIVIDPGHSGGNLLSIDAEWNMIDSEYDNGTENHEMYDVGVLVRTKLTPYGFNVLLTKTGPDDIVSKRDRVNMAINNNADLFISIHRDAHTFGTWGHVYVQRVGDWRYDVNKVKKYFTLVDVAAESKRIGDAILKSRKAIEGSAITMAVQNYTGRGGNIPGGNLTITQLWNTRPALLMEAGICNTQAKKEKYAQGIVNGILAALPIDGVTTPPIVSQIGTVVNCNVSVNVRSGPSTGYSIIGQAPKGKTYTVLTKSGTWYKVQYTSTKIGYISSTYLLVKTGI